MFDHILRILATFAVMFVVSAADSLPTWLVLFVAFACVVAFIYEIAEVEEHLRQPDELPDTDTPIAHQVAREQEFDLSNLDRMDRDFKRNYDLEL